MADRGSWASPELFQAFTQTEAKYRTDYIAAVERGDNATAQKMLREQGVRANSLNGWKETMGRAAEIQAKHPNLSKLIQGDAPGADGKRALIKAIADCKLDQENVTFDENGEMVFNIEGLTGEGTDYPNGVKSKDIDKIMTTVLSPVVRENSFRKTTETIEKTLAENPDASFDMNAATRNQTKNFEIELHANPESAYSIMNDTWAGKTSLADDLEESIRSGALAFEINLPTDSALDQDGDGKVSLDEMPGYEDVKSEVDALQKLAGDPPKEGEDPSEEFRLADKNNDGVIDAKDLDETSIKKGIQEDPSLLAEVAGGWSAMKQENIHKAKQEEAKQKELKELYDRVSGRGQLQLYTSPTIKDKEGNDKPNPNYNAALARYIEETNKKNEEEYLPNEGEDKK
jgi:Ca2+-binding EF-hand superfamily protein